MPEFRHFSFPYLVLAKQIEENLKKKCTKQSFFKPFLLSLVILIIKNNVHIYSCNEDIIVLFQQLAADDKMKSAAWNYSFIFLYSPGVMPSYFLKNLVRLCTLLYPTSPAISAIGASVCFNSLFASSIRMPFM
mgnify:CR=1 FL=1